MYKVKFRGFMAVLTAAALFCGGCGDGAVAAVNGGESGVVSDSAWEAGGSEAQGAGESEAQGAGGSETQGTDGSEAREAGGSEAQGADGGAETVRSVAEIYAEIQEKVSLQSPQCMDEEFISNYYGIDVSILEEYVFSMSEDAAQAETIILMKVKEAGDLGGLADCLQTIVDEKKNEMENYIPEQFAIVEKSRVRTEGNYIWLIISDNADEITDIVESGLL